MTDTMTDTPRCSGACPILYAFLDAEGRIDAAALRARTEA